MRNWLNKFYDNLNNTFIKINSRLKTLDTSKEDKSNKSTTLSNANNTTYPTTKAVSDAINSIPEPVYPVRSVNSKTGDVIINKGDVGLGNVDNTSDLSKPVSTATAELINQKIAGVYKVKPSVATFNDLPKTGNEIGDARNVIDTGDNYVWSNGDAGGAAFWDKFAGVIDLSDYYDKEEVDEAIEEAISDIPTETPTLQEVTDKGNTTNNVIHITGLENLNPSENGLILGSINEGGVSRSQIIHVIDQLPAAAIDIGDGGVSLGAGLPSGNSLNIIKEENDDTAGARFSSRVEGRDGVNPNDFVTKKQLDAVDSPFEIVDADDEGKAIVVKAFDNVSKGMTYGEGAIDFGILTDSSFSHKMGVYAIKFGANTEAVGAESTAFGSGSKAIGYISSSFGYRTEAIGDLSTAFGQDSKAEGKISTAFGDNSRAEGQSSVSFGQSSIAEGEASTSFGNSTIASGRFSTVFGDYSKASGSRSTAFGNGTEASGESSASFGESSLASGKSSVALGKNTTANEYASLSIGRNSTGGDPQEEWVEGSLVFKVGNGIDGFNLKNAYELTNDGKSRQEGIAEYMSNLHNQYTNRTLVDKEYVDIAISNLPTETPTLQEVTDKGNITSNALSISGGSNINTNITGLVLTSSLGGGSIYSYNQGIPGGYISFGNTTILRALSGGEFRLAPGMNTSSSFNTRVSGVDGVEPNDFVTKQQLDAKESPFETVNTIQEIYTNKAIVVKVFDNPSHGMKYSEGAIDFGISRNVPYMMGRFAFRQGDETSANGANSAAFGSYTRALGTSSFAAGQGSQADGIYSAAFGSNSKATGNYAVAFGGIGRASGEGSSVFGVSNEASGKGSSAFGNSTIASGESSSSFGYYTRALGRHSFSIGRHTVANEFASLVMGRYNTEGDVQTSWVDGSPIFKVGNGTSPTDRKDAYRLYNDGRSEQERDMEVTTIGQGFVLKSPDGTRWRITINIDGALETSAL